MPVSDSDGDPPGTTDSDSDGGFTLTRAAVLSVLGISLTQWNALTDIASDPRGFVETIIFDTVIRPFAGFIVDAFGLVANALLIGAFGADKTPFDPSSIGLLDPPLLLGQIVIDALAPLGDSIIGTVSTWNQAIASIGAETGVLAPIIVPFLWLIELGIVIGVAWWIIRAIDFPVVDIDVIVSALFAPVRFTLEVLGIR